MYVHGVILFLCLSVLEEDRGGLFSLGVKNVLFSLSKEVNYFHSNSVVVEVESYNHCFKIFLNQHISFRTLDHPSL